MARRDEEEDWARELNRPDGYPFLGAIIGAAITGAIVYFGMPYVGPQPLIRAIAGGVGVAATVWALAWLINLRHAGGLWQWGAFLIMAAAGAGAGWFGTGVSAERMKLDVSTVVEMRAGPGGKPIFPPGAMARGPVSRLFISYFQHFSEDLKALDDAAKKVNFQSLSDAAAVTRDPSLIADCGRMAAIKITMQEIGQRQIKRLAGALAELDGMALSDRTRRNLRSAVQAAGSAESINAALALEVALIDEAQAACTIYARRRWKAMGPMFMFTNNGDLAEVQGHQRKGREILGKLRQLSLDIDAAHRAAQHNLAAEYGL